MSTQISCERFRERLVDARDGTLPVADRREWDAHRAACPACAAEAARDAWVCQALGDLAPESPPPAAWSEVLAARRPQRSGRPLTRPALAFATAAIGLFLLAGPLRQHHPDLVPSPPPPAMAARSTDGSAYADAHELISMTNLGGDPNRAVVLVYGGQSTGRGGS